MLRLIDFYSSLFLKSPVTNDSSEPVTASPCSTAADTESIAHPSLLYGSGWWACRADGWGGCVRVCSSLWEASHSDANRNHISLVSPLGTLISTKREESLSLPIRSLQLTWSLLSWCQHSDHGIEVIFKGLLGVCLLVFYDDVCTFPLNVCRTRMARQK